MLDFIYGRAGTGKSGEVFRRASASAVSGARVFVLVPDRDAVGAERRASTLDGAGNIDVVTFRRLCNYIFRAVGGICRTYISRGAKKVIMHNLLCRMSGELSEYGSVSPSDTAMTETLVKAKSELERNAITPARLADAAEALDGKTGRKLSDIAKLFAAFDAEVKGRWSDPDGMISAAASADGIENFFGGRDVYIDAFSSFTAQQYQMIEKIVRGAANVCITLGYEPDEDKNEPAFMTLSHTDRTLHDIAKDAGAELGREDILREPKRTENDALTFLSANLWSSSRKVSARYDASPRGISVISAANPYAEAEAVAVDIMRRVQGGMRYRDIAIVTRSTEEYSGIIDAVFDKYEIPYFVSEKTDITELSLIKFSLCALYLRERGFVRDELLSYMKTDLCGIAPSDGFAFENYVIKWGISGNGMLSDFVENPRGIGVLFTEDDEEELKRINSVRRAIVEPLTRYFGVARNAETVRDNAEALFDFLSSLGVPERLSDMAERAHADGELSREATLKQLWRAFCDALDGLAESLGETECGAEEFRIYLSEMLSETDIGRIPTSIDEVVIADAALTDVGGVKAAYVIGCFDGGFPKRVGEDGIFTENEKAEMESAGIEISSRLWRKLSDEMYYFYTAVSSASQALTLTFPRYGTDGLEFYRSAGINRIFELFPRLSARVFEDTPPTDLIYGKRASFEYALRQGGAVGDALREYYSEDPEYGDRLALAATPLCAKDYVIDAPAARELFGKELYTSPSRLEKYVRCNFAYFCDRELKLSDDGVQRIKSLNVGTFLHKVMEIAVKYAATNPGASEEEVDAVIADAAKRATDELLCAGASARVLHMTKYLCKSARRFVEDIRAEMAQSKFTPLAFELEIGSGGVEPISLSNGRIRVKINGKIDRVDVLDGNGEAHILVSDYKSGSKIFDLGNVALGQDMQMLLYLFSLWENGEKYLGKKVTPAGVVYVGIDPANICLTAEGEPRPKLKKSGLFLADIEVLRSMDANMRGEFVDVTEKDYSDFEGGKPIKNLASLESFETLKREVAQTVLKYAGDILDGVAHARPTITGLSSPCNGCRYFVICRNAKKTYTRNKLL